MPERIGDLAVALAPEGIPERLSHFGAGVERARAGAISNAPIPRITGVSHSNATASDQSTYCEMPPRAPPSTTTSAELRLYGARPMIARAALIDVALVNSVVCTATITRYASPKASPLPENACGTASVSTK